MKPTGLHLLLSYQCTFECDHCFVWGSPWQGGTMTLATIRRILEQGKAAGTVRTIFFEGGEPFLYYGALLEGVRMAAGMGFEAGIVTNVYWATSEEDAVACLRPFAGLLHNLTISTDLFHYTEKVSRQAENARAAARTLGIDLGTISVARPCDGERRPGEGGVMFRGRAAVKLAAQAAQQPWLSFTTCPHEKLDDPGRLHVDAFGNLHICQGISVGNLLRAPLADIFATYDPVNHAIVGPLLYGGPAELVRRYHIAHAETYADACHLCYEARLALRERFPDTLAPDQMYGAPES